MKIYWPWRYRPCDTCGELFKKSALKETTTIEKEPVYSSREVIEDPVTVTWHCGRHWKYSLVINEQGRGWQPYKRVLIGWDIFIPA